MVLVRIACIRFECNNLAVYRVDFPGVCYASTQCRTFKDGEEWDLKPFCGMAKCVKNADGKLEEHVRDCGLIAKEDDNCKISAKTNATLPFPNCCPIYDCVDGKTPTFPTSP